MVQIFTDTAANLPMKILDELSIKTMPLTYEVDGAEPDRSVEFNGAAFYGAMRAGAAVKTSMVNPEQAAQAVKEYVVSSLRELEGVPVPELVRRRQERFSRVGVE